MRIYSCERCAGFSVRKAEISGPSADPLNSPPRACPAPLAAAGIPRKGPEGRLVGHGRSYASRADTRPEPGSRLGSLYGCLRGTGDGANGEGLPGGLPDGSDSKGSRTGGRCRGSFGAVPTAVGREQGRLLRLLRLIGMTRAARSSAVYG